MMNDYLRLIGWLFFCLLFQSLFLVMVSQLSSAERESVVNNTLVCAVTVANRESQPRTQ
jgi:hypothetical protein